ALNRIDLLDLSEAEVIWHTDQGKQYGAAITVEKLLEMEFTASMSRAGTPTDNAIAERFVRTFKHAVVRKYAYETIGQFAGTAEKWLNFYNERRPHRSLGLNSPNEFARKNSLEIVSYLAVNSVG
ncbi:MAG: transposase, partial [Candidatus Dojkabacteria bacterium]